jgi:hypothetical protein
VDFLLECIGFPPDYPNEDLVARIATDGEPAAWRGDPALHRRLPLGEGLELRMDKEPGQKHWNILPDFKVTHRLRVAIEEIRTLPDSPFDALLIGWAAPHAPSHASSATSRATSGAYRLCAYLSDARRLPKNLPRGHVLAVSLAGFALDVTYLGPNDGVFDARVLDEESGASIRPLGAEHEPGGCAEVSLRIKEIRHLENPITHREVQVLEVDAPERPLQLFVSPWQLAKDGWQPARPGWRIEGTFMFSGRVAGGLPSTGPRSSSAFG